MSSMENIVSNLQWVESLTCAHLLQRLQTIILILWQNIFIQTCFVESNCIFAF